MKKLTFLLAVVLATTVTSCRYHNENTSISYTNTDDFYSMKASFSERKTKAVEAYLDKEIGHRTHTSFVHTWLHTTIDLNDQTVFYIKKSPGYLQIEMDKHKNAEESIERIKKLCEGVKAVVTAPM